MAYNEYLTTINENPYKYYWKQINLSLDAMTQKQETKDRYLNHFNEMLGKEAAKMGVSVTDKKMLAQLCFKACQSILLETVLTCGTPPHVAYALEYFNYAPSLFDLGEDTRSVNFDQNAYYNQLVIRLEKTLTNECNSAILNNLNSQISYNVIDLEKLRRDLRQIVNNFYIKNPEARQSYNRIQGLQTDVTRVFSNISLQFDKKNSLNKSNGFKY